MNEFMAEALRLAAEAAALGEVPVGAVVVRGNEIVGRGRNCRETDKTALGHAECMAIMDACRSLGGWRLWDCTMYVTLEPCPMCAGAIVNARIPKVVCAAADEKNGACGSAVNLFALGNNFRPAMEYGQGEAESKALLDEFFRQMRENPKPKWKKPE